MIIVFLHYIGCCSFSLIYFLCCPNPLFFTVYKYFKCSTRSRDQKKNIVNFTTFSDYWYDMALLMLWVFFWIKLFKISYNILYPHMNLSFWILSIGTLFVIDDSDWLTHWFWDKMTTTLQTAFSHAFSWIEIIFQFRFHWMCSQKPN